MQELLKEGIWRGDIDRGNKSSTPGINEAVGTSVEQAKIYVQSQEAMNSDETGFTQHNGDGEKPSKKRGAMGIGNPPGLIF